jgi:hypothetical protein
MDLNSLVEVERDTLNTVTKTHIRDLINLISFEQRQFTRDPTVLESSEDEVEQDTCPDGDYEF